MADDTSTSPSSEAHYGEVMGTLFELMEGFMLGHVLRTGVELGVFEALGSEPKAAGELARELGLQPEETYRLLRALAYTDFVAEEPKESFSLTPLGRYLQQEHPNSIGDGIRFWFHPKLEAAWSHLPAMIGDGPPDGFEREFGKSLWEHFEDDTELSSQFHHFMSALRDRRTSVITAMLDDYDFERFSHVCDVGGGHGHMLSHLLDAHPHLEGTVLDLPNAIEQQEHHWAPRLGVDDRCTYEAGDMLEGVPRADAYFLQGIVGCPPLLVQRHSRLGARCRADSRLADGGQGEVRRRRREGRGRELESLHLGERGEGRVGQVVDGEAVLYRHDRCSGGQGREP